MFVIENEYFLIVKNCAKKLRLIIICFWILFMVSKEVLINERLKRNTNELKSNLVLSNQRKVKIVTIINWNLHTDKQLNLYLFRGKF